MRTLVFTATEENLQIALAQGVMGFSGRTSPRGESNFGEDGWVNEPVDGDRAVLYAKGVGIVGIVDVTSSLYRSSARVWQDADYPYRVTLKPVVLFTEPLHLPDELTHRLVTRRNPRLLSEEEVVALRSSIGSQLIAAA